MVSGTLRRTGSAFGAKPLMDPEGPKAPKERRHRGTALMDIDPKDLAAELDKLRGPVQPPTEVRDGATYTGFREAGKRKSVLR